MAARRIEKELERLGAWRNAPESEAVAELRKALGHRVNVVAAKAAQIAAERRFRGLIPDLLAAFDRLFEHPVERDPQCWGKNAIAKALRDLDHRDSAPFRRGFRHVQMEPVWGKFEDSAQQLRGICLLALVACTDLTRGEVLRDLIDALTESEAVVRVEALRGLSEMQGDEAALLLRMKARLGDEDPQVIGQVFDALLKVEGESALAFAAQFLVCDREDVRAEAALAMGASRFPRAVELLCELCRRTRDHRFREILFRALALSRQPEALEYLKAVLKGRIARDAEVARAALEPFRESSEIRRLLEDTDARSD